MSVRDSIASFAEAICANDNVGYDQVYRWLNTDVDCSALSCLSVQNAGVPVIDMGASFTGDMLPTFLRAGFIDCIGSVDLNSGFGLERGDILLTVGGGHTAIYLGNNLIAQAVCNEFGGITGGQAGDQTGMEVAVYGYSNFYTGWEHVLRYAGDSEEAKKEPIGIGKVVGVGDDVLNVRTGAGITYPLASWSALGEGNLFEVCDEQNGWFYIRIANAYYGWVNAAYVEYTPFSASPNPVGWVTGVYPYTLNVRTGAGTEYPLLPEWSALAEDNAVDILDEVNGWYKVRIAGQYVGYVSAKYIRR